MSGPARRRRAPMSDLLDEDHVGGLLARIRAVGCLIGAAAEVDPVQVSVAGWLVEALAAEAQMRLREEVRRLDRAAGRPLTPKAPPGRRP